MVLIPEASRPKVVIPEASRQMLSRQGTSEAVIDVVERMANCIYAAAEDVANSTDAEYYFDDATGRGQLLYRRARNRVIAEFEDDEHVVVSTADNALHVYVDDCVLAFYSARDGLDQPHIGQDSRTKRRVVDEMQLQLEGEGLRAAKARRLVVMNNADSDGMVGAAAGVLKAGHSWSWRATLFDRFAASGATAQPEQERGYEEQPEAEIPDMPPRAEPTPLRSVDDNAGS